MKVYTSLELTEEALQIHVISERGDFFRILVAKPVLVQPVLDEDTVEEWLPRLEQRCGENVYKYFSGDKGFARWDSLYYDIKSRKKLVKVILK